jgi:hypothetical protein
MKKFLAKHNQIQFLENKTSENGYIYMHVLSLIQDYYTLHNQITNWNWFTRFICSVNQDVRLEENAKFKSRIVHTSTTL